MNNYDQLQILLTKITDLSMIQAVLSWDQETQMPKKGGQFRAQQMATLSGLVHEHATSKELGDLLEALEKAPSLNDLQQKNVALAAKDFKQSKKYTQEFVVELSMLISKANQAWADAKKNNDFKAFAPFLKKLVALKRKECEFLGYKEHPYDALLEQFEPGTTTAEVKQLFADVRSELVGFVKEIREANEVDDAFMFQQYDKDKQWKYGLDLLTQMGFDFEAGRQDISSHPFSINFSPQDVRVTTRIDEKNLSEMMWSCIHEGGHALYEQGMPVEQYGMPVCSYISLGIHESQSRLWENNVGRGLPYWKHNFPKLKKLFPEQLANVDATQFYQAANKVESSLIRTNADELTYHFHVLIRFEIELALIEGKVEVEDLPELWNAKYKEYLDIDVPSDTMGVLQDVHWSHGSFGYFPTYSIGSFYAAQFYNTAKSEVNGLEKSIAEGNMKPMLDWLREKVHQHGKYYTARELCEKITGEPLNFRYFMEYAKEKYGKIYQLSVENTISSC